MIRRTAVLHRAAVLALIVLSEGGCNTPLPSAPDGAAPPTKGAVITLRPSAGRQRKVPMDDIVTAARAAARSWAQVPCAVPRIAIGEPIADAEYRHDGVSVLLVRDDAWCPDGNPRAACYEPDLVALTRTYRSGAQGQGTAGPIIEADVQLNAIHHRWGRMSDAADPRGREMMDLENALAHEFGHVLGLADVCGRGDDEGRPARLAACLTAPRPLREATMYPLEAPGQISRRTPESADVRTACALYGHRGT